MTRKNGLRPVAIIAEPSPRCQRTMRMRSCTTNKTSVPKVVPPLICVRMRRWRVRREQALRCLRSLAGDDRFGPVTGVKPVPIPPVPLVDGAACPVVTCSWPPWGRRPREGTHPRRGPRVISLSKVCQNARYGSRMSRPMRHDPRQQLLARRHKSRHGFQMAGEVAEHQADYGMPSPSTVSGNDPTVLADPMPALAMGAQSERGELFAPSPRSPRLLGKTHASCGNDKPSRARQCRPRSAARSSRR